MNSSVIRNDYYFSSEFSVVFIGIYRFFLPFDQISIYDLLLGEGDDANKLLYITQTHEHQ